MTTSVDAVWRVLRLQVLSQVESEQVINRFFGRQAELGIAEGGGM